MIYITYADCPALRKMCYSDMQSWKHICSLGLFYILPSLLKVCVGHIGFIRHASYGDI